MNYTVFFDGSVKTCRGGSTGPLSWAWVVLDESKAEISRGLLHSDSPGTAPESEYLALVGALSALRGFRGKAFVCGDSQLIIEQIRGNWKTQVHNLIAYRDICYLLIGSLERAGLEVNLVHVGRGENLADRVLKDKPLAKRQYTRRPADQRRSGDGPAHRSAIFLKSVNQRPGQSRDD